MARRRGRPRRLPYRAGRMVGLGRVAGARGGGFWRVEGEWGQWVVVVAVVMVVVVVLVVVVGWRGDERGALKLRHGGARPTALPQAASLPVPTLLLL